MYMNHSLDGNFLFLKNIFNQIFIGKKQKITRQSVAKIISNITVQYITIQYTQLLVYRYLNGHETGYFKWIDCRSSSYHIYT